MKVLVYISTYTHTHIYMYRTLSIYIYISAVVCFFLFHALKGKLREMAKELPKALSVFNL